MKTLLLVDDNEDDAVMTKMACRRTGIPHQLYDVSNGERAIEYLSGTGKYADRTAFPLPDVIFLDLHMPKINGHQVLEWIRSRPQFAALPVVMLTNSVLKQDIDQAYALGTTSYIQKLSDLGQFGQAVRVVLKYWLEINLMH